VATYSDKFRQAYVRSKMSQTQIASEAGVKRSYVAALINGTMKQPAPAEMGKVARVLGLDLRELLALTDQLGAVIPETPADPRSADFSTLFAEQAELIARQNDLLASQVAVLERIAAVLEHLAPPEGPGGLSQGEAGDRVARELADESARRQGEPSRRRDHSSPSRGGREHLVTSGGTGSSRSGSPR
jgi:transcriptional regulator with XRE-family HTH domain